MKENVLQEIRKLRKEIAELNEKYKINNDELEELKKDDKVMRCVRLLEENQKIKKSISTNVWYEDLKIKQNCNHEISKFIGSDCDPYEGRRYYHCRCLECGKAFETSDKYGHQIETDINFDKLHKEYFDLLIKYNAKDAINIMVYKYKDDTFNELISSGVEITKALKLMKKLEK